MGSPSRSDRGAPKHDASVRLWRMKIRIDSDTCTGHGRCYTLAPALF
ncbi:MAG: ferredoxin, partial [Acidimicrobiales bacterium]